MTELPDPTNLIFVFMAMALVPFVAVMVTSFAKIIIIFFLVRNALGIQQIPPNIVLYGLTIILTTYLTMPLMTEIYRLVESSEIESNDIAAWLEVADEAKEPFRAYLIRGTDSDERQYFLKTAKKLWPEPAADTVTRDDLMVLIPAFTVSELTSAFQAGALLYLPFLIIDLIISNILLALGMMMVSPLTISLPFKLFLFVAVDGWSRLVHGIVTSYQ